MRRWRDRLCARNGLYLSSRLCGARYTLHDRKDQSRFLRGGPPLNRILSLGMSGMTRAFPFIVDPTRRSFFTALSMVINVSSCFERITRFSHTPGETDNCRSAGAFLLIESADFGHAYRRLYVGVPFVIEADGQTIFLKTAYPSRKLHERYGGVK